MENVRLNFNCRDEILPILRALQHLYTNPLLRHEILKLVEKDVNRGTRKDRGREGLDYWQVLVLAAVRLGCNLNYDKLQNLAEQYRALRQIMGIGDWDESTLLGWRRIRDDSQSLRRLAAQQHRAAAKRQDHQAHKGRVDQPRTNGCIAMPSTR